MEFKQLQSVTLALTESFSQKVSMAQIADNPYESMKYPRVLPMMHFKTRQYNAAGFGRVFAMYTKAMGGLMQLSTVVFTPCCGANVPLLLIDSMAMAKKRAAFVEYYDCTSGEVSGVEKLREVAAKYASLPDYDEKPAWYIGERTDYSLIKGGDDDAALLNMLLDSVEAYASVAAQNTDVCDENKEKLSKFVERMVRDGNPSSETMNKVLGADGAEKFFRSAVMPLNLS